MECEICGVDMHCPDFVGTEECPVCGQSYEYEDGARIVLTPEQIKTLYDAKLLSCLGGKRL